MIWLKCVQASQFLTISQLQKPSSADHIIHMQPLLLEVSALLDVLQEEVFYTKPYSLDFVVKLNITAYVVIFSSIMFILIFSLVE